MLHPEFHIPPHDAGHPKAHMTLSQDAAKQGPLVGLFVTCLVDLFRPSVGFAAIKLLEAGGARVEVPFTQTCCGQPAFNSGDRADAVALARNVIESFERFDYVVAPSGSCAGMIRRHYPELLGSDPDLAHRAEALAAKTFELTSFLVNVLRQTRVKANFAGTVTYHRFLLVAARARHRCIAAEAARERRRAHPDGACRARGLLRVWRRLLGEISCDLHRHPRS